MDGLISFTIIMKPRGQARHRHRQVSTKDGRTFSQAYKTKDQIRDEKNLAYLMLEHRPPQPLQGGIALSIRAYLPIPQSKPKKWMEKALNGEIAPETKPDASNILKHFEDVGRGIFYHDDKQIHEVRLVKRYGDPPRYEVEIRFDTARQMGGNGTGAAPREAQKLFVY